jgi:hypothetical protein
VQADVYQQQMAKASVFSFAGLAAIGVEVLHSGKSRQFQSYSDNILLCLIPHCFYTSRICSLSLSLLFIVHRALERGGARPDDRPH